MTWQTIFGSTLSENWLFSAPVAGEWFRVNAQVTGTYLPPYKFWGYVGQAHSAFTSSPDFYSVRRLYPFDNKQVIRFVTPDVWGNDRAIAIKGVNARYSLLGFPWFVTVEVWEGTLPASLNSPDNVSSPPPGFA